MLDKLPIISVLLKYLRVFLKYTGPNLYLLIFSILVTGVIESIGITAAIPLINIAAAKQMPDDKISGLFQKGFDTVGIEISVSTILVFIAAVFLIKTVFIISQTFLQTYILTKLGRDLKTDLMLGFSNIKYEHYIHTNTGYFINNMSVESTRFFSAFKKFLSFLALLTTMSVYCVFSMIVNFEFSLIVFSIGGVLYFSLAKVRKLQVYYSGQFTKLNKETESTSIQFINNYKYLKSTGQVGILVKRIISFFETQRLLILKSFMWDDATRNVVQYLSILVVLSAFYYLLEVKLQTFAEVVVPLIFVNRIFSSFTSIQSHWQKFLALSASIWEVDKTRKKLEANTESLHGESIDLFQDKISLESVSLCFDNKVILDNVSFEIKKNSCVGFAGSSGAGKTTLLDIITSILSPTSGRILIDGVDYAQINKESIRQMIGYITQETIIFNDTIGNNISMWDTENSKDQHNERLNEAALRANCLDFINDSKDGFDKNIGEKGIKLSGGQRQRIGIARELYRNSNILIFDEATSALDTKSEKLIQKSIDEISGHKTMILVAHRLSTLRNCDVIYVMDRGRIVEKGTWQELLGDQNSLFAKMFGQQIN
jgi:ABC-type multidrug transport system fused ATPase/permease subunit